MLELQFSPFPVLVTNRLTLRKISEEDIPSIFAMRSSEEMMRYIDRPRAQSTEEAAKLVNAILESLAKNEGITWAITVTGQTDLAGTIGFWKITPEHYRAEIGYMLRTEYQHQGIMHEALSAVLDYGFKEMNLHSVEANVNPANEASIRLLERNKFVLEGRFRENYYYNGQFLDSNIYSLLTPLKQ